MLGKWPREPEPTARLSLKVSDRYNQTVVVDFANWMESLLDESGK